MAGQLLYKRIMVDKRLLLCVTEYMAKAIILKIFLTLFLLVSLLTLSHTVSAQASVDCSAALAEATKGKELIADWSNPGGPGATCAVKNEKKEIKKPKGDSCILALPDYSNQQ